MHAVNEFEILYNSSIVKVKKIEGEEQPTYRLLFSNEVPEITISCTTAASGENIWLPVPAGNTELAAGIGKLIEARH